MRALCGAIITAGAFIGLGLASLGAGSRYTQFPYFAPDGKPQYVQFWHMDTALEFAFVVLAIGAVIGLGITFVGLAFHHHRRQFEMAHLHRTHQAGQPPAAAQTGLPEERVRG